mmetsp:Transcript_26226/g.40653  ORF Transcript_26226/g.40653 Transcript_26226/m.40653 type:complete len:92 (+) Transcript_26226:801-1076(+)
MLIQLYCNVLDIYFQFCYVWFMFMLMRLWFIESYLVQLFFVRRNCGDWMILKGSCCDSEKLAFFSYLGNHRYKIALFCCVDGDFVHTATTV